MKRTIVAAALAVPALLVGGCSSADSEAPAGPEATSKANAATYPSTTAAPTATQSNIYRVGERVENGGVAITVKSVTAVREMPFAHENYRNRYETKTARPGGQLVIVATSVDNIGKKSLDLTCGYAVVNKLFDVDDRQFDPIDSLYRVEGNPECNDNLQPGFSADMTYVYEIPDTAKPHVYAFYDPGTQSAEQAKYVATGAVSPPA